MKTLLVTLCLCLPLAAGERIVKLGWDANALADNVTGYELWMGLTKLGLFTSTVGEVRLPYGECAITIRSVSANGTSDFSAPLVIPSVWSEMKVTLEFSEDLATWSEAMLPSHRFARARPEPPNE